MSFAAACDLCGRKLDSAEVSICDSCGRTYCPDCDANGLCDECEDNLFGDDDDEESDEDGEPGELEN